MRPSFIIILSVLLAASLGAGCSSERVRENVQKTKDAFVERRTEAPPQPPENVPPPTPVAPESE